MIPVKICGITNLTDALCCVKHGASALGFIFAPSKRQIQPEQVLEITRRLPLFVTKIGVFVNEDPLTIKSIMKECRLDLAQLHGNETPEDCEALEGRVIKAFKAGRDQPDTSWNEIRLCAILIDSFSKTATGGTGETFDWRLFQEYNHLHFPKILAGGLNPTNLLEAIAMTQPDAVDVSSGLEIRPGIKDENKVSQFMKLANSVSLTDCNQY